MDVGVGNRKTGGIQPQVVIIEDVDVYQPVVIDSVDRLFLPPQLTLNALRLLKQGHRRQPRAEGAAGVQEPMGGLESPRLCLYKGRHALQRPNTKAELSKRAPHILLAVAEIGSQTQIDEMKALSHPISR